MQILGNYVLITEVVKKGDSSVGLIDTDTEVSSERYQEAIIDEIHYSEEEKSKMKELEIIKKGDHVLYDRAQGYNVTIDNKVYRVVFKRDVAVIL